MSEIADKCREMGRYQNALKQDWSRKLQIAADEIDHLEAENERLRKALEPFAEAGSMALTSGRPPGEHVDAAKFLDARSALETAHVPPSARVPSLLKRMSGLLDDLPPDETIGFSNGVQWVEVATVEEIRAALEATR